jgi:hypothetical protein
MADKKEEQGSVFSVSGPVVVAENMIGCAMYELVCCPPAPQLPSNPDADKCLVSCWS